MNSHEQAGRPENHERASSLSSAFTRLGLDVSSPEVKAFIARAATGSYDLENPFESLDDLDLVGELDGRESKGEDATKVRAEILRRGISESPTVDRKSVV